MNDLEKEILDAFFNRLKADKSVNQTMIDNLKESLVKGEFTVDDLRKILSVDYTEEKE